MALEFDLFLGMERLEGLLPDIIANSWSPRPTVREGFMSLLVLKKTYIVHDTIR